LRRSRVCERVTRLRDALLRYQRAIGFDAARHLGSALAAWRCIELNTLRIAA